MVLELTAFSWWEVLFVANYFWRFVGVTTVHVTVAVVHVTVLRCLLTEGS